MPGEPLLVFLLQTLKENWRIHKGLKKGEQHELEQLDRELSILQEALKDSAKRPDKNNLFRQFDRLITELVYDVEDTIATCMAKKAAAKAENLFIRTVKGLRTNMAKKVKSLRENRVKLITDSIQAELAKIVVGGGTSASLQNPLTERKKNPISESSSSRDQSDNQDQFVASEDQETNKQDEFVEFEDEETIKGWVNKQSDKVDVICITGMPGIGKTTLAKKVYQHRSILEQFSTRIWIPVSKRSNSTDVYLLILERFMPKASSTSNDEYLIETVTSCLKKTKFLIVVDDLWSVEDWDVIKKILPKGKYQGKVLVTSREDGLAGWHIHKLKGLRSEASLNLLKLKVFDTEICPLELEHILQVIANNCGEVPLIIVVIGGILNGIRMKNNKAIGPTREEWLKVSKDMKDIGKVDERSSISNALQLSYDRLSDELKLCFLYTGLFPKNQEIPASTLTKLWIAEGFIQGKLKQNIEEAATKVLNALIYKNLLMASKKNMDQVKTCLVHDMIRGFCIDKATEENVFTVINASTGGVFVPPDSEIRDSRRLSLHSNPSRFLSSNPSGPRVRSFLCFLEEDWDMDPSQISTIPNAFNLLRILNCKSIKFSEFPKLTRLILLKHIIVSIDNLSVLPEQISKLLNLETLIVDTKSRSITVKANIWNMTRLRRFKTKAAISLDSSKKGKSKKGKGRVCEDLETMSRLSPDSCTTTLWERAPMLKTLGIQGKVADLFDTFPLVRFGHLEKLKIVNDFDHESEPRKAKLPQNQNPRFILPLLGRFPPNLNRLTLSKTYLQWNSHMSTLASINTLKILKLKDNAFTGDNWSAEGAGFKELQFLLVENIQHWEDWTASSDHFPNLRWLVIRRCPNIQQVPNGAATKLEKLEIEHVNINLVTSAKNIAEAKGIVEQNQQSPFKLTIIGSGYN